MPDDVARQNLAPIFSAKADSNSLSVAPPLVRPHLPEWSTFSRAVSSRLSQRGHLTSAFAKADAAAGADFSAARAAWPSDKPDRSFHGGDGFGVRANRREQNVIVVVRPKRWGVCE